MDLSGLPRFSVVATRQDRDGIVVTGRFLELTGVRNEDGWIYRIGAPAIVGTLSGVPAAPGETIEFRSPNDDLAAELVSGETYPWVDGSWQAYQITMILTGQWEPRRFVDGPAHYFRLRGVVGWQQAGGPLPDGAEDLGVREGGWDHEHCEICNAHVGGPADPDGYVDTDAHWLCKACYERYAESRDISFATEV